MDVLVDDDVLVEDDVLVVDGASVVLEEVVEGASVVLVVVTGVSMTVSWPSMESTPGPGRPKKVSAMMEEVCGMQNTDTRSTGAGVSTASGPAGAPARLIDVTSDPAGTHVPPVPQLVDVLQPSPSLGPPSQ
jgi:hypothetical protein